MTEWNEGLVNIQRGRNEHTGKEVVNSVSVRITRQLVGVATCPARALSLSAPTSYADPSPSIILSPQRI